MQSITYCQECEHCFENKRSKTGYSCSVWGYDDFACDTVLDGFCHKAKPKKDTIYPLSFVKRFESVSEAVEIINDLKRIVDLYGFVTRADYLDLIDVPADHYSAMREGWLHEHVDKFKVFKANDGLNDGYYINIPKPLPID